MAKTKSAETAALIWWFLELQQKLYKPILQYKYIVTVDVRSAIHAVFNPVGWLDFYLIHYEPLLLPGRNPNNLNYVIE